MSQAKFFPGQIIQHQHFGYRGVIYEVDSEFSLTDEWYEQVAQSRPPKDQPWYRVLVDEAGHTTYVAERHLSTSPDLNQVQHPLVNELFNQYNGERYFLRQTLN